jgi:hypothetical protein
MPDSNGQSLTSNAVPNEEGLMTMTNGRRFIWSFPVIRAVVVLALLLSLSGCTTVKPRPIRTVPEISGSKEMADTEEGSPVLRFDGIYQSEREADGQPAYWSYVRFYADGAVIEVGSTGDPLQIRKWFTKENNGNKNFSRGRYEIKDDQVAFSTTSDSGTVDYEGAVHKDGLVLRSYSHINEYRATRTYRFVHLSEGS